MLRNLDVWKNCKVEMVHFGDYLIFIEAHGLKIQDILVLFPEGGIKVGLFEEGGVI